MIGELLFNVAAPFYAALLALLVATVVFAGKVAHDIDRIEKTWRPHRSAITNALATLRRPEISPGQYDELDALHRSARRHLAALYACGVIPPMVGILGTLVAVLGGDLRDASALSESFQTALGTTIGGLIVAITARILVAGLEPRHEHVLKEFESILETVFREGAPVEAHEGDEDDGAAPETETPEPSTE